MAHPLDMLCGGAVAIFCGNCQPLDRLFAGDEVPFRFVGQPFEGLLQGVVLVRTASSRFSPCMAFSISSFRRRRVCHVDEDFVRLKGLDDIAEAPISNAAFASTGLSRPVIADDGRRGILRQMADQIHAGRRACSHRTTPWQTRPVSIRCLASRALAGQGDLVAVGL